MAVFREASNTQRSYLNSRLDWIKGNSSIYSDYSRAVSAAGMYAKAYNSASVAVTEAESTIDLAVEDAEVRMDALDAQASALQSSIEVGLLAASATAAAGCAQAAYSVRSVSATARGTSGMTDSGTRRGSTTENTNVSRAYTYTKYHEN